MKLTVSLLIAAMVIPVAAAAETAELERKAAALHEDMVSTLQDNLYQASAPGEEDLYIERIYQGPEGQMRVRFKRTQDEISVQILEGDHLVSASSTSSLSPDQSGQVLEGIRSGLERIGGATPEAIEVRERRAEGFEPAFFR